MPVQPITGQRRYRNGGSVSKADWKLLLVGLLILVLVHIGHDYLGLRLPSSSVLEFLRDVSPIVLLWLGLRHARTHQP